MFAKSSSIAVAAMLAMAPLYANAHMIMANPVPYGAPNNSPLEPSGSDFPCKSQPYTVNKMNEWSVGSTQSLAFTGTAVHNGGSCQISVTTDKEPTKDSVWKAIYSIEGGCPGAPDQGGNFPEGGPNYNGTFPFTIPTELPNGEMTMAWTWFNKVGNREMYMNCAPITVSGGSDDKAAFESLPDMAVANIKSQNSCTTPDSSDYTFENPDQYKISAGKGPFAPLCGGKAGTGGDGTGAPAPVPAPAPQQPAASQPAPANPGIPSAAPAPSQAPAAPSASVPQSTLRTILTVTAPMGPSPTTQNSIPAPSAKPAPKPSQAPGAPFPVPGNGTGAGTGTSEGTSCSPDGAIVCSPDGTQFAICNHGSAVFQAVAAGTKCQDGKVAKREYKHRHMRTVI